MTAPFAGPTPEAKVSVDRETAKIALILAESEHTRWANVAKTFHLDEPKMDALTIAIDDLRAALAKQGGATE